MSADAIPADGPLLALDTSGRDAVVGLAHAEAVDLTVVPREAGRHARSLVPTLADVLTAAGLEAGDLAGVAVNLGPGSFTGLRVGVTVAQMIGWSRDVPLVGCGLFELLAHQSRSLAARRRLLIANAEREELFVAECGSAECRPDRPDAEVSFTIASDESVLGRIDENTVVLGDIPRRLQTTLPTPPALPPLAESLAVLGRQRLAAGACVPPAQILPVYGRRSAAEELREAGRRSKTETARSAS